MNEAVRVLAVLVEPDILHQDLSDALRHAAHDLSFQQQRIDHGADVIDHAVADDLDFAGFLIDLQLADMAAIGEVLHRRGVGRGRDEARHRYPLGRLVGSIASFATSLMVERAVGLGAGEHAVGKIDLVGIELEEMRGNVLRLAGDPFGRDIDRRAADGGGARAAGAFADKDLIGIALDIVHLLRVEAEAVAHDLLEDRFVPLALGHAARPISVAVPDLSKRISAPSKPPRGRALDGVGKADAAQLAALARLRAPLLEAARSRQDQAPCPCSFRTRRCHR